MILVFAPNPALERVALVDQFKPAEPTQRPMRVATFAGGAGLRAANVARLLGGDVLALGFVGGHLGALLRDCLDRQDIPHVLTPIAADTRGSFLVLDREKGIVTEIPEPTPAFTPQEADRLIDSLKRHLPRASLLLVADGPDGNSSASEDGATPLEELFLRAFDCAREANVPVLADVSGGAAVNVAAREGAWLVRVGLKTLQRQTERSLQHDSAIFAEAWSLVLRGVENVVVTIGDEGAFLINRTGAWRIKAPIVSHFNATGSGETLSGALAARWEQQIEQDIVDAARYGTAAASVNVTHDEPGYATPGEVGVLYPRTTAAPVSLKSIGVGV